MNSVLDCATSRGKIDLVVYAGNFIGRFRLPAGTTEDIAWEVQNWCLRTRLLDLWSSSRRNAALTLYATAALIADQAVDISACGSDRSPEDLNRVLEAVRNAALELQ